MRKVPFKHSSGVTLGVELEFQIIDPETYDLASKAKDLMRQIRSSGYQNRIKPEITQSMIEVNSSVHHTSAELRNELLGVRDYLADQAKQLGILFCGGGTHPFQRWNFRKIFPTKRFKRLSREFRYLSKQSTIFGQHIHVGCQSAEDALYLTHILGRYVPQLIAIMASSPFYQGEDTGYDSSRLNSFAAFPSSGIIPYFKNWDEFSSYFYKMRAAGILQSMKDVYWDVRPKPEFGTVEVRVCDTPLTIETAVMIASYLQSLSNYIIKERPFQLAQDLYDFYSYNRFQACRHGFAGIFINPFTFQHVSILDDITETLSKLDNYSDEFNNADDFSLLRQRVSQNHNDASFLRHIYKIDESLPNLVHKQAIIWEGNYHE